MTRAELYAHTLELWNKGYPASEQAQHISEIPTKFLMTCLIGAATAEFSKGMSTSDWKNLAAQASISPASDKEKVKTVREREVTSR